jgi:hypothetical protein
MGPYQLQTGDDLSVIAVGMTLEEVEAANPNMPIKNWWRRPILWNEAGAVVWIATGGDLAVGHLNVISNTGAPTMALGEWSNPNNSPLEWAAIETASVQLLIGNTSQGVDSATYIRNKGTGALYLGTNNSDDLTISNGGNVGIGTNSPAVTLHVQKDVAAFVMKVENDGNSTASDGLWVDTRWNTSANTAFKVTSNSGLASLMTVKAGGAVGIGTASPSNTLSVGDAALFGSFNVHAWKGVDSFTVTANVVKSESIRQLTTASAAGVGIDATTGIMYRLTSALKYKTDVETMADEYADAILDLRPVWYKSLGQHDPSNWGYWGLIAEEVAAVDPRLVHYGVPESYEPATDAEGEPVKPTAADLTEPEGVQYERFVPHLINLVARQRADIEELRKRLAVLEA